jgi:hypothetical protein
MPVGNAKRAPALPKTGALLVATSGCLHVVRPDVLITVEPSVLLSLPRAYDETAQASL